MICVVIFGQKPDRAARLAAGTLSRFGAVQLHTSEGFELLGNGLPFCTVEAVCRLERLLIPGAILVLSDQTTPRRLEMSEDVIVIAGTDNRRMRRLLEGHLNPVVTCGTGSRDTLTVSSITPERAVLCAQRELPTVFGTWLEPMEFAAQLRGCSLAFALPVAGIAAVCGCVLSDRDMIIGL